VCEKLLAEQLFQFNRMCCNRICVFLFGGKIEYNVSGICNILKSSILLCACIETSFKFLLSLQKQDEVFAVKDAESPKGRIVIRAEDFSSWLVEDLKWNWGLMASSYEKSSSIITSSNGIPASSLLSNTKLDLSEVEKEKGLYSR
jgi:hypothetical protein